MPSTNAMPRPRLQAAPSRWQKSFCMSTTTSMPCRGSARCSNDRVILPLPLVEFFDEPGIIEFLDEAIVDERPRVRRSRFGIVFAKKFQQRVDPSQGNIGCVFKVTRAVKRMRPL